MKAGQIGGWVWWASVLWAILGAAGSIYIFVLSTHLPATTNCGFTPCWVGEPGLAVVAAKLGAAAWLLLASPVLVTGLIRLRAAGYRAAAWAGAWIAGVALMGWVADWQTSAPAVDACSKGSGCILIGYSRAVVSWGELPACAAFVALGAVLAWILAGRALPGHGTPAGAA